MSSAIGGPFEAGWLSPPVQTGPPPFPFPFERDEMAATFFPLLALWLCFPLHAPLTLLVLDAPFGKFAWTKTWLNIGGNFAWFVMEIISPLTFAVNLAAGDLTPRGKTLAALFLMHYAHRAIISPLFLAPKRSPIHLMVLASAWIFNILNGTLVARALVMYPPRGGWTFYVGVAMWALGFMGNVYHDEILHDLRRAPRLRLVSGPDAPEDKNAVNSRYRIPRGGLFRFVSFPNYLCEWIEWTGFALAAAPTILVTVPEGAFTRYWIFLLDIDVSGLAALVPHSLLHPAWAFVLAEVTSMLPRAIRGHAWYKRTFANYPKDRSAVVPGLL